MKASDIRKSFLEFFEKRGHAVVPSSSLVPKGDPTLLFTNAGMVQFKKVFLNEEAREYKRAASSQKCVRAGGKHNDLENVGRTARHHTFFEMLGNFSFGDYFKEGAIDYAWDFLTVEMKLPVDRLWVTVFETDDEAARLWKKKAGLPDERIVRMGAKDNFWSMGDTGPCGPCSEILIDQGKDVGCASPDCRIGCDCDRFLEIWNLVFMQYDRAPDGKLTALPKQSIDTGMGLERLSAVMQGRKTNYESDLFMPIMKKIEELAPATYGTDAEKDVSIKAIADHARAVTFLMADGVLPSNEGRGYVLRRIIRRAVRHGKLLGVHEPFLFKLTDRVIEIMGEAYPEIVKAKDLIRRAAKSEEDRFLETLERGLALLDEEMRALRQKKEAVIPGDVAFKLYDTFGFPSDLTAIIVAKEGFSVDEEGFALRMGEQKRKARKSWKGASGEKTQQDLYQSLAGEGLSTGFIGYHIEAAASRVAFIIKDGQAVDSAFEGDTAEIITEETPFYAESGGQVGDTGVIIGKGFELDVVDTKRPAAGIIVHHCKVREGSISTDDTAELIPDMEKRNSTRRNHTATHLLHAALRKIIGSHVRQAGSLVHPEGLRFDFTHFEQLDDAAIKRLEEEVNKAILMNRPVATEVLRYQEAVAKGALAFFGEKYGDTVRMVNVEGVSTELCGGTHVNMTGDIGLMKITSEGSVASGVRRIEAVTGRGAFEAVLEAEAVLKEASRLLKAPRHEVPEKIKKLLEAQRELEREIESLRGKHKANAAADLMDSVRKIKDVSVLAAKVETADPKELREMADALRNKLGSGIIVLAARQDSKAVLLAAVTKDLTKRFSAGEIIKRLAPVVGGKGGGKEDLAQAGGNAPEKITEALDQAYKTIEALQ